MKTQCHVLERVDSDKPANPSHKWHMFCQFKCFPPWLNKGSADAARRASNCSAMCDACLKSVRNATTYPKYHVQKDEDRL